MRKALIFSIVLSSLIFGTFVGQIIADCRIDGKYIMQNGKDIGRYDGKYIVRTSDGKDVGRRDGKHIVRISDGKDACRQDGKYVINVATGKDLGTGDAAAVCLCAGLLY
ncbi:membrane or secreted protein [Candidatus Magnetomorum sp. HK-1]|nr:membrane or secreted protein [Candidatus Magnetomorum sp. HK-1]